MTPNQLLEEVKARFPILLHDNPVILDSLLKKALAKYQELAGFNGKMRISETDLVVDDPTFATYILLPSFFAARLNLKDATGRFISCSQWDDRLELKLHGHETFPFTLLYAQNILEANFDEYKLPTTSISLLGDYLELLIAIPNAERQRRIATAGKLDTSDIALEADLNTRKTELETSMRLNRAMIPPISLL